MSVPDSSPASTEKSILRQHEIEIQLAALKAPTSGARAAAAKRLGDLQAGVEALLETLNDPSDYVRGAAAVALSSFTNHEQAPEIIDALLTAIDDPSEKVCQAAIRSLGMLHADTARPEIEEFLNDPNPYILGAAILSLSRLGASDLAEMFAGFLKHESNYVKTQAARAVGLLHYQPAGDEITRLLRSTRQARMANNQSDLAARLERREDDLYNLQNHLIRTAGDLKIQDAAPLLIEIAQKDIGLRGLAVEALIEIGADVAPELLTGLLADPSVYLRRRMILLMAQFDYQPALPLLRPLMHEESASVRSAALQAITQMRDAESLSQIQWMSAHDSNPFVRIQALQSLTELIGRDAIPILIPLANDPNFQLRREAVTHLLQWETADPPVLAVIAHFAKDFPEDDLTPAINQFLQDHDYTWVEPPAVIEPVSPNFVPPQILADMPVLLEKLVLWQQGLWQNHREKDDKAWKNIDDALSCLIEVLERQKHSPG